MKRYTISALLIFCLLFSITGFADEYVEGGSVGCPPADLSIVSAGTDIDSFTTTSITPWLKQFHITIPEQVAAGFRGGECGQMMFSLAVSPLNQDLMLLGTDTESVWRSEDGGLSWIPSDEGLTVMGTNFLYFSPYDEKVAFVTSLVNEATVHDTPYTGLYKSVDGGKSWNMVLKLEYTRSFPTSLIKYSESTAGKRVLYTAGNKGGMYKSCDDGETWESMGLNDMDINSINVIGEYVLAFTKTNGIMATADDGATWTELNKGIEEANVNHADKDPLDDNRWFAITDTCMYESTDKGQNWMQRYTPKDMGYDEGKVFNSISFAPVNSQGIARMFIRCKNTQYPVRYSDDYGKTVFKPIADNNLAVMRDNWGWAAEPYCISPNNPDDVWISLDGQLMKSNDGGTNLYAVSSGYSGMRANNFYFNLYGDINDFYIALVDRTSVRSLYSGGGEQYPMMYWLPNEDRFANVRTGGAKTSKSMAFDPKNNQRILECRGKWNTDSQIKESLNGGLDWVDVEGTFGCNTKFMAFNPDKPNTIYAGNFVSYDDGKSWSAPQYSIVAMSPFMGNVVYAVAGGNVYKSNDEGRTWSSMCSGLPTTGIERVSVDKFREDKLYIGTFNLGYYVAERGKVTHVNTENGIKTFNGRSPIMSVAQDPENELHLICGGRDGTYNHRTPGLYESYDGGENWNIVPGLQNAADIFIIEFRPGTKQAWIGTSSGTYVYEYDKYFDATDTLYKDIDDSYAREDIINLYNDGLYSSFTDGVFAPKGSITRAEFAKLIKRLLSLRRKTNVSTFIDITKDDVSSGGYDFPAIQSMYDFGLLALSEDGRFNPDIELTYEQITIILSRILNACHVQNEFDISDVNRFDSIPEYARYAYYNCLSAGVLDDKISFEIGRSVTNEDVAHMLFNLKKVVK